MKRVRRIVLAIIVCANFSFCFSGKKDASSEIDLVDVKKIIPDIVLDIRYATENNFMKKKLYYYYASQHCFLRSRVAAALKNVQDEIKLLGWKLKIFDGYRPFSVQKIMYEWAVKNRKTAFVGKPTYNSASHPRGTTVDLTIVDEKGKELEMPTKFDDFTIRASHNFFKGVSRKAIKNREFLKHIMEKHGFKSIKNEWWHYNIVGYKSYNCLDVNFSSVLKK